LSNNISGVTYSWSSHGGVLELLSTSGNSAVFKAPDYIWPGDDMDRISCIRTINGHSAEFRKVVYIDCWSPSPVNAYPNPVKDILNIEILAEVDAMLRTKGNPNYDIRLYNSMGSLVRQTTTRSANMQFNVSHLPNGTYYLHIYNGINEKPEIKQIIVQH